MYRWMKTNEVFAILNGPINQPLTELPYRLPHGSYILVTPTKERGWKNDGYSYIPRHNGIGTREDVEKLKINGKPVLVCSYSQTVSDTVSSQSLNRRIYKLIEGDSNVYLVHYLLSNPESAQNTQQEMGTNNPMEAPFFSDFLDGYAEPNFSNCNQPSSTNHANDDILLQRIHQLEQRITYLEYEKTSYSTHKDSSDEFNFSFKEANQIRIMDYSPEWDYIEGGVKMMLCYQPIKELGDIQIVFGDHIVNATCIQPGVLKCIVPSNSAGKVQLQILQSGFSILDSDQHKEFEYKENKKQKKQKMKPRLMQKDEYREGEFKVRVIEKLTEFQQHCLQQQTQQTQGNNINIEQVLSPDNLDDCLMNTIIENCFKLADINNYDKFNEFLDSKDQHGFCLIHYLTVLEYQSTIKLLVKYGGNINLKGLDNLTPLQIAVMLQKEKMVGLLIQLGAIDQSYAEGDLQSVDQFFTLDELCQNKCILDLLVRGVTLCDSIHNSSSMTEQSWNEQDDQEDAQFIKLTELMEDVNYNQSQVPQPKQDLKQARHKYLRSNKKHDCKVESKNFAPDITYDEYADHVKVIQKNVRSWLLRRQYLDIKYATQVLQNFRYSREDHTETHEPGLQEQDQIYSTKLAKPKRLMIISINNYKSVQLMDKQVQNIVFGFQLLQSGFWIAQTYLLQEEFEEIKIIRVCAFNIIAFRSLETILQKYRQNQYIYQFTLICRFIYFVSIIEISMSQATDITLSNTTNSIIFMIIFFNQQYKKVVHFKYIAHILQVYALFRVATYYESIWFIIEPGISIIVFTFLIQRHTKEYSQGDKYMTRAFKVQSVSEGFKRPQLVNNSFDDDEDVEQIGKISQEIINLFPLGIIVVNSKKQVEFMNPRCERILEVHGEQNVMDTINRAYTLSCNSEQAMDNNIIINSISQLDLVDTFLGRRIKGSGVSVLDDPQSSAIKHKFSYSFYSKEHHMQQKLRVQVVSGSQDKNSSLEGSDNRHNILFLLIKNVTQKTHLKKLEQELHFQNSLLKSFSHELRTPLNCSIQMLTLAKQKASADIMDNLNIALTQNQLLIYQINDILDFAAFQCTSFQYQWNNFCIKELFTEVMDLYEYQCRNKQIKLSFDVDAVMLDMHVLSDKQRIMQVLVNLMNNSLKFTAMNGFIQIKLEMLNPGIFQIAVCDNGVGIQEQKFKKMSSQLKDTNDTFGLGINVSSKIVWGLAKQNLEIHSQPGKGTRMTFTFTNKDQDQGGLSQARHSQVYSGSELPLIYKDMSPQLQDMQEGDFVCVGSSQHMMNSESDGIEESDEEGGLQANPNTFFKMKRKHCQCIDILIVDDVPSNQIALKCLFKSLKLNIDQAYDGMSAIQQVKEKMYSNCCQNYAVIIMDIEMPNMDGFEASTKILQISQTNIIMCSAYGGIANTAQAQKVGISDTLSKPVRREELIKLLQKYMDYT